MTLIAMFLGVVIALGAFVHAGYRHFFPPEQWLVEGTWEPSEPPWPRPQRLSFSPTPTAVTTRDGFGFTPSYHFRDRAMDAPRD